MSLGLILDLVPGALNRETPPAEKGISEEQLLASFFEEPLLVLPGRVRRIVNRVLRRAG